MAGGWFALLALVSVVAALSTYSAGPVYEGDALVGLVFGDQRGADWQKFADERARVDAVAGVAVFVVLALVWGALRGRVKSAPLRAGTAAGVLAGAIFYALAGATRCTGNGHDFNVGSRAFVLLSAAYAVVSAALLAIRSSTRKQ